MSGVEWLENLKTGDKVLIKQFKNRCKVATITGVNKKRVKTDYDRLAFKLSNGAQSGGQASRGAFLMQYTPANVKLLEREIIINTLIDYKWDDLPIEALREVIITLDSIGDV
jgi:hypothetical protein